MSRPNVIRTSVLKAATMTCAEILLRRLSSGKSVMFGVVAAFGILYITLLVTGYSYYQRQNQLKAVRAFARQRETQSKQETTTTSLSNTRQSYKKILLNTSLTKTILLWDLPKSVSYPENMSPARCGKCVITRDRAKINQSDAVVFHFNGARRRSDLPPTKTRHKDQIYVWTCRESPKTTKENYNLDLSALKDVFNWTMTHRLDSDVFYPYAEVLHRMQDNKLSNQSESTNETDYVNLFYQNVEELISQKNNLVAWVVGNCGNTVGAQARMKLVDALTKHGLQIHKFGRCFKDKPFPPYRSEEAHAILTKFKFYLAFENTYQCRDYVTYKFWKNGIYSGAVPIVWGPHKSDVLRMAPKGSFLHIDDFVSAGHLVNYLKYIASNDTAYREFFAWREKEEKEINKNKNREHFSDNVSYNKEEDWIFSRHEAFGYCKLCRKLHAKDIQILDEDFTRKTIPSLQNWWYGTESKSCFN